MNKSQIQATELTTFDVDLDGKCVRLHMRDDAGQPATLILPTACLNQLLMTLPEMVQQSLRRRYGDQSLRLVHKLEAFQLELGEVSAAGARQFILTLATAGGFAVSFSATEDDLDSLGEAINGDVLQPERLQDAVRRLS